MKLSLYRGTRDVLPQLLNHRKLNPAVYGLASYYALSHEAAEFYAQGGSSDCPVVVNYELEVPNLLIITPEEWAETNVISNARKARSITRDLQEKLKLEVKELAPYHLAEAAHKAGYDAVLLKGDFEGGAQLVIPDNDLMPHVLSYSFKLSTRLLGTTKEENHVEQLIEVLAAKNIKANLDGYKINLNLSSQQLSEIKDLLEFIEYYKHQNLYSIDYAKLDVEHYEDEY